MVAEEIGQKLVAVGAKLERYDNRTEQYSQNCLFESNRRDCSTNWKEHKKKV